MIHGVEEVLILLFIALGHEYLFLSDVIRALKSDVYYSGNILIVEKTHDKNVIRNYKRLDGQRANHRYTRKARMGFATSRG